MELTNLAKSINKPVEVYRQDGAPLKGGELLQFFAAESGEVWGDIVFPGEGVVRAKMIFRLADNPPT